MKAGYLPLALFVLGACSHTAIAEESTRFVNFNEPHEHRLEAPGRYCLTAYTENAAGVRSGPSETSCQDYPHTWQWRAPKFNEDGTKVGPIKGFLLKIKKES